jgi:hypothetical protein
MENVTTPEEMVIDLARRLEQLQREREALQRAYEIVDRIFDESVPLKDSEE